ncbi:MAG: NUDIX domain-containing protein [Patescibacteria group bacterium]
MIDTSNDTIVTTNALLYKTKNEVINFLLVQENDNNWGLPGGAKEVKDQDLLSTIQRELEEELELEPDDYILKDTNVKREFEYNHFQSSRFGKHGIVIFFLVGLKGASQLKVSNEIKSVDWFTREEAIEKLTFNHIKDGFKESSKLI